MSGTRVHSKLGASAAKRWLSCPGSVALCAALPEPPESKWAREGSAAHRLGEVCLERGQQPADFIGKSVPDFPDVKVSKDMAKAVKVYTDFARSLGFDDPANVVFLEAGFALADFDAELFGHNDLSIYQPAVEVLHVVDYKHGAGVTVEAEDNPQIKFYGLGALLQLARPVQRVDMHIVQPRGRGNAVKSFSLEPIDLWEFGVTLQEGAEATRQPNAPLVPGDHCRFCKAAATCPKLYADALAVAAEDFAATGVPDEIPALSSEEIGKRLKQAEVVTGWVKALEAHAYREAMAGRMPAGRKFIESLGHRQWKDGALAMRQAVRTFNLSEAELFTEPKPVTPAEFERIAKTVATDRKAIESFMEPHLADRKKSLSLVDVSHKRPAVNPVAGEFDDITESDE